jgi:hypothetical protein
VVPKVAIYPGNVLALHMSKPQGFRYKSGQYMFVNCAAVSPFEWLVTSKYCHSIFCPFVNTSKNVVVIALLMGNHMSTGTHFLLLQPLEMTTSVFTLELSVIGQGSFEQCSQRFVF